MANSIVSVQDGPRLTVSQMVKQPTVIPARIMQDIEKEFIVGALLRTLPKTNSGVYAFTEGDPLFAEGDAEIVEEFGEIPVIAGKVGRRRVAFTVKRALAHMVSQEMIDRNDVDRVNKQIKQIRNTFIRTWERSFLTALVSHPDVPTINASAMWDDPASSLRTDIAEGMEVVADSTNDLQEENYFGFEANTLVIGKKTKTSLITSDDFNKVYRNSDLQRIAPEYTGTLPGDFWGLKIMVSREMDRVAPGRALLLEAKTVGGIGDERPMSATPLYPDRPRETWRSDVVRRSAVVIDQPKAATWINGVGA